jgi:hypothetical protein
LLRNSERSTFKRCEFLWALTYRDQLKPLSEMPALRYGTLIHMALADYYVPGRKRKGNPVDHFARHYEEDLKVAEEFGVKDEDGKWLEAGDLGEAMLSHYVEEFGSDDRWEVVVTEQPFRSLVHHPETGKPWFYYAGVIDLVMRDLQSRKKIKDLWVWDHKTTAGIGPSTGEHLKLDDQAGGYWSHGVAWLYSQRLLKADQVLTGMMYNFLRKAMPDDRPFKIVKNTKLYLNKDGSISKVQPSPFFLRKPVFRDSFDREQAVARSVEDYRRIELARAGDWNIVKNPGLFNCPMCSMSDICELHEVGADFESMILGSTKTWEPYAEHEIYTAETK